MLFMIYGLALHLLLVFSAVSATTPAIVKPANGSFIAPNANFDFQYHSIADYGTSSFNYSVFLFTSPPRSFVPSESFATGYHFGRFAQPNYPGNPSPQNTPPSTLKMPDFSKLGRGWGAGAPATHAMFYLAVIEEYETGSPSIGFRMSLTVNEIIYNGTHH